MRRRMVGIGLLLALMVLALLCSCENSVTPPAAGKMHIFVYGNDYLYGNRFYYEDGTLAGYGYPLRGTVNDAMQTGLSLCALAQKAGYEYDGTFMLGMEPKEVSDPNVTVINNVFLDPFLLELDALGARISDGDITIFFFSGHGLGEETMLEYGSDASERSYFAFRQIREASGAKDLTSSILYPDYKILSRIETLPGTKVVLGDFCFSGAFVRPGNVSVTPGEYSGIDATRLFFGYRDDIKESSSLFCLTAARYYEKSWEPGGGAHGYFTAALLKALGWDEKNQTVATPAAMVDNRITLFGLVNYVAGNDDKAAQTPMTNGGSNDIILFSL